MLMSGSMTNPDTSLLGTAEGLVGSLASLTAVPGTGGGNNGTGTGSQQKDTTWTKLFVGGLPYHTTDKSLRDHFAVYGDIEEAVVITDRQSGKSRGYGFVIMGDRPAAERACKEPNPIIDGRKANVNLAILGAKPRGNLQPAFAFPSLRAGYSAVLPSQFGIPSSYGMCSNGLKWVQPSYLYQNQAATAAYLGGGGVMPLAPSHAAAMAAATSQFYEYQNAAAAAAAAAALSSYPSQYAAAAAAAASFDPYTTAAAAGAANYVTPYSYAALPSSTAGLPTAASSATAFTGLSPYTAAAAQQAASLQEARLQ